MRILPRSLFSRLVLVLVSGLAVAQMLSLALHLHDRGELLLYASGMQAAQRIADIVKVLDPLPIEERRRMVTILSAPPLLISLNENASAVREQASQNNPGAAVFAAMLRQLLGPQWPINVALTDNPPWQPPMAMPGFDAARMHGEGAPFGPAMHYFSQPGMSFLVSVHLHDGTLATFDSREPPETLSWPYRVLGSVAILLVTVILLSLIAVRWATRPLKTLADAADELGRNLNRAPVAESGPDEVRRAAHALNTMQARLIGYIEGRTRILAAMSHDLKTPITRLRLRSELLEDPELRSKFGKDLEEMEAMVSSTLAFMHGIEDDEATQTIDVNALLETLQADAQETGGIVEIEGAVRKPYLGKPQALKRCLGNLLDNAIRYGKSARILISDTDEQLEIRVQDQGPGIPEASFEQVFQPFYRLESSRSRETGGTGLGLTIARSIAQGHGGRVTLRNLPQGGLEATLSLPRAQSGSQR